MAVQTDDAQVKVKSASLMSKPLADYYLILISVALLLGLGLMMVLSASTPYAGGSSTISSPFEFAIRQAIFLVFGVIACFVASRLKPEVIARLGWFAWGIAVVLLIYVAIGSRSIGDRGNTNWVSVNSQLAIQPSEFAKLALVVWAASVFAARVKRIDQPKHLVLPFVPAAALVIALVLAGRDLGTGMVLGLIVLSVLWFIGTPMRILGVLSAAALLFVGILTYASPNRMDRVTLWLDPSSNPDLAAQPVSALYAMASGGFWGVGLGMGKQKWGGLKNAAHSDFIFAVIGEELGLIGVLLVLGLFAVIGFVGLRIALRSDQPFTRILAAGLTSWFVFQALINIMVVLNMLPVLGIPLPFISYGGSALVANLIGIGFLLACARNEPEARKAIAAAKRSSKPKVTKLVDAGARR